MSNEIKTRPLTPTEQKYTYAQSMQLEGQTGTIGHAPKWRLKEALTLH